MDTVILKAYAKINLFLEVCEKRPDNYHNIDSVMHTVSLHDIVSISKNDSIVITNDAGLPNDKSNLAYKAAVAFFQHFSINGGCKINIQKNIPVSAGLAGGSANAAAVLKGLNAIYNIEADINTLCQIGSKLGADIPFCIKGGCCITKGIGDVLVPCSSLPTCFIVVSKIGEGVSTPQAYNDIDRLRDSNNYTVLSSDDVVRALYNGDISAICQNCYNAFESAVMPVRPFVQQQKDVLSEKGALFSMMSGSGPSVFGIFDNIVYAENAVQQLLKLGAHVHLCTPVSE